MGRLIDFSASLLWPLWRAARATLPSNARFALLFHAISKHWYRDIPAEVQPDLTINEFSLILTWLKDYFGFLTPEEFLSSTKSGVLLTFDDGLANNLDNVLPVVDEHAAPAIFFVTTQHVERPRDWLPAIRARALKHWKRLEDVPDEIAAEFYDGMSRDGLRLCARNPLVTIGSHTVSHPFLTRCDKARLQFELHSSKRLLRELTGQEVDLFAYPTGNYDRRVAEAVNSAGYRAAFAVNSHNIGIPPFEIPRIEIYSANRAYLAAKLSGLHRRPIRGKLLTMLKQDLVMQNRGESKLRVSYSAWRR